MEGFAAVNFAYVCVDLQKDFVEGGKLPTDGALAIAHKINQNILSAEGLKVVSQDWHIAPGTHFSSEPNYWDSFPEHCVANTEGAEFIDGLNLTGAVIVRKGQLEAAFSAFEGHTLDNAGISLSSYLAANSVDTILVCGLLLDYCVMQTCLDGIKLGYTTVLLTEYTIGSENADPKEIYRILESKGILVS